MKHIMTKEEHIYKQCDAEFTAEYLSKIKGIYS
jgi:hypothetical protein